jgi:hypothetical protein
MAVTQLTTVASFSPTGTKGACCGYSSVRCERILFDKILIQPDRRCEITKEKTFCSRRIATLLCYFPKFAQIAWNHLSECRLYSQ